MNLLDTSNVPRDMKYQRKYPRGFLNEQVISKVLLLVKNFQGVCAARVCHDEQWSWRPKAVAWRQHTQIFNESTNQRLSRQMVLFRMLQYFSWHSRYPFLKSILNNLMIALCISSLQQTVPCSLHFLSLHISSSLVHKVKMTNWPC